jgi:hypothetical protein
MDFTVTPLVNLHEDMIKYSCKKGVKQSHNTPMEVPEGRGV